MVSNFDTLFGIKSKPQEANLEELLAQQQRKFLENAPSDASRWGQLIGATHAGGARGFGATKAQFATEDASRQSGIQNISNAVQRLTEHEDNLSMQERQLQSQELQQARENQIKQGNFIAGAITEMTGGNQDDANKLFQFYINKVKESGGDDDDWTPQQMLGIVFPELQRGLASGEYTGPAQETVMGSPGSQLLDKTTGAPIGDAVPRESLARLQDRSDIELKRAKDLAEFEAKLDKKYGTGAKPDVKNVFIEDPENNYFGQTTTEDGGLTYQHPTLGKVRVTGGIGALIASEVSYDVRIAAKQNNAIRAELKKMGVNTDTGMGGIGTISGKLGNEVRSAFKALTDSPGVGPWSKLGAGLDQVLGGLEIPAAFGYEKGSLFPKTEINRNYLRTFNQFGKRAFINNTRMPVMEQNIVRDFNPDPEKWFQNPDTEVRKLFDLHDAMLDRKAFHLETAMNSVDPKTRREALDVVNNINGYLRMMGIPDIATQKRFELGKWGTPEYQNELNLRVSETPEVGAIEDGYRFKGGDPSDSDNWEKE